MVLMDTTATWKWKKQQIILPMNLFYLSLQIRILEFLQVMESLSQVKNLF